MKIKSVLEECFSKLKDHPINDVKEEDIIRQGRLDDYKEERG